MFTGKLIENGKAVATITNFTISTDMEITPLEQQKDRLQELLNEEFDALYATLNMVCIKPNFTQKVSLWFCPWTELYSNKPSSFKHFKTNVFYVSKERKKNARKIHSLQELAENILKI
jgi:hypothetical protein